MARGVGEGVHRQSSWGVLPAQEGVMVYWNEAPLLLEHEEDDAEPIGPVGYRRRPLAPPSCLSGLPYITAANRATWSGFDGEWGGFMYQRYDGGEPAQPRRRGGASS
jgi:hypothetical protein